MNSLCLHRVTDIEIATKSLDEGNNNIVDLVITSEDNTRFEVTCFLDNQKGFKALDLKALLGLIKKHTVIE